MELAGDILTGIAFGWLAAGIIFLIAWATRNYPWDL